METKIDDILDDYSIDTPERTVCRVAAEVISDIIGTNISTNSVQYQHGTLWVDTDPLSRSQIHLHKDDIRSEIAEKINNRRVDDIH